MRLPTKPLQERLHEVELLDLEIDHLRLQFLFCRSQLRTLFSIPPLLIATQQMSKEFWATLMRQPQEIEEGKSLLMDLPLIEEVVADHIQMLGSLRSTLSDLRIELHSEQEKEILGFETEIRAKLDELYQLTKDSRDSIIREFQARNIVPNGRLERDDHAGGEGIPEILKESDLIEDNASYMEGVENEDLYNEAVEEEELDERDADPDAAPDAAPNAAPDAAPNLDADGPQAMDEDRDPGDEAAHDAVPEEPEAGQDPLDDDQQVEPDQEEVEQIGNRIEEEMRNVEQAIRNFDDMLFQLEAEPICQPRRFDHGRIHKPLEKRMKCAFCDAIGSHYSDSCMVVSDARSRRMLIEEKDKCERCLERICARGYACKKYHVTCFHCRNTGHHSALCPLPERSDVIRRQLQNAREGRWAALSRMEELRRELALLRNA